MTETPDANDVEIPATSQPEPDNPPQSASDRPSGLPEKFWDAEQGAVRTDALVKSYMSLEQRFGAVAGDDVPESPEGYKINGIEGITEADPDVNAKLHDAGFTQAQAQLVYDMAAEYLAPVLSEMATHFESQNQVERLAQHFGGEDKWRETAAQLKKWGETNFPEETFRSLSSTYEGVLSLHRMMAKGEPGFVGDGAASSETTEAGLKQLMRDPRYWRDHEPGIVRKVKEGFQRLYPDKG